MKILLLDIETAPNVAHVWGLWEQNVGLNQLLASGYVMCWAAKWLGSDIIDFDSIPKSGKEKMLSHIHTLLDEAEVVVHYNGKKFDIPTLNKEFVLQGMQPASPYRQIDLLEVVKREFKFPSNKLDYVTKELKIGGKYKHAGHELWIKCMDNQPEAWEQMEKYNINDVLLLERLYAKLKPWIRNHPNYGVYNSMGNVCPVCGSEHLVRRGYTVSRVNRYHRFQCKECGAWSQVAKPETTKEERQALMRPA